MDLQTIRNRIIGRGIASSLEADITTWINEAYQEIWNEYDWIFKRASASLTVSSANTATALSGAASDIGKVSLLIDSSNYQYQRISLADYVENKANFTNTRSYYQIGTDLYVSKTGTFTVMYEKTISELTNETDTPSIPTRWQQAIIELAYAKALFYDDDTRYNAAMAKALNMMKQMKKEQNVNYDEITFTKMIKPDTGATV